MQMMGFIFYFFTLYVASLSVKQMVNQPSETPLLAFVGMIHSQPRLTLHMFMGR